MELELLLILRLSSSTLNLSFGKEAQYNQNSNIVEVKKQKRDKVIFIPFETTLLVRTSTRKPSRTQTATTMQYEYAVYSMQYSFARYLLIASYVRQ